jgi:alkaline phosphatase D
MLTVLQVSDAHLSPRNVLFRENLALVGAWAAEARPDLIVASGDISLDGADRVEDLELAARLLRALPAPLLAVPGNHDVGSHARTMPGQPVDAARLARFRRVVGADWWVHDGPGWRLIGLNTEIMGTGLPEEAEQARFIAEAAASAGPDRRIAVFQHKPAFVEAPEDPVFDYWSVPPEARGALAPLLDHPGLRLLASGHLHLHRMAARGAALLAWAPALAFVVEEALQESLPGERFCGALVHRLGADGTVATEVLAPEGTVIRWLSDIRAETYPA